MRQKEKLSKDDGSDQDYEASYRSMVGCLMYLTTTRPKILQVVSFLHRFVNCASEMYMKEAKRVKRYVKGTLRYGVRFQKSYYFKFQGVMIVIELGQIMTP